MSSQAPRKGSRVLMNTNSPGSSNMDQQHPFLPLPSLSPQILAPASSNAAERLLCPSPPRNGPASSAPAVSSRGWGHRGIGEFGEGGMAGGRGAGLVSRRRRRGRRGCGRRRRRGRPGAVAAGNQSVGGASLSPPASGRCSRGTSRGGGGGGGSSSFLTVAPDVTDGSRRC